MLPAAISPQSYLRAFRTYAHALNRFAPGVPLLGPAVANPSRSISWITQLVDSRPAAAGNGHRAPLSVLRLPGAPLRRLADDRAAAERARHCGQRAAGQSSRRRRPSSRTSVSDDRAELGDLWGARGGQRHVRGGPVGAGRTVRAASQRRRRGQRPRARGYGQRGDGAGCERDPRSAAALRADSVRPGARYRSAARRAPAAAGRRACT